MIAFASIYTHFLSLTLTWRSICGRTRPIITTRYRLQGGRLRLVGLVGLNILRIGRVGDRDCHRRWHIEGLLQSKSHRCVLAAVVGELGAGSITSVHFKAAEVMHIIEGGKELAWQVPHDGYKRRRRNLQVVGNSASNVMVSQFSSYYQEVLAAKPAPLTPSDAEKILKTVPQQGGTSMDAGLRGCRDALSKVNSGNTKVRQLF